MICKEVFTMKTTLGQRIAALRKNKGLTQEELADKLNISNQAISKWENDQSEPDVSMLLTLSKLFDISVDELLGNPLERKMEVKKNLDTDLLLLQIKVLSNDGDTVKIRLPLAIVKALVNSDADINLGSSSEAIKKIDWNKVFDLAERGIIGEIINVSSADGDIVKVAIDYEDKD